MSFHFSHIPFGYWFRKHVLNQFVVDERIPKAPTQSMLWESPDSQWLQGFVLVPVRALVAAV
jgi:hypothetical protein